jgi:Tfp pilus assembly protein PilN
MIEINLLPGTGRKKKKSGGGGGGGLPKIDFGAMFANLRERVQEPWLIGGVATTVVAVAVVGALYVLQTRREAKLEEVTQRAVQDSTRYAAVLKEREKAEAKRDTVLRSLNLIRAIDDDRFIWPHVMDEVSRALPPYTWLVSLGFSGTAQAQTAITTIAPAADTASKSRRSKHKPVATVIVRDTVRLRLVGNTVDIQALTRFMKALEVSQFLEQVQLAKSERANDNGKEVTQFQLDMLYTRPSPTEVRRVPLAVSVR